MKGYIERYVPEEHRENALAAYNLIPNLPQLPSEGSTTTKERDEEEGEAANSQAATSAVTFSDAQRGTASGRLQRMINYTVIILSLLAQFQDVYEVLAF